MGLELQFRTGLQTLAQASFAEDRTVAALLKLGFVRDQDKERLFIPVKIEAEALALGFEENDLDKALAPVRRAVELANSAKAELDIMVEKIRDAAKRK